MPPCKHMKTSQYMTNFQTRIIMQLLFILLVTPFIKSPGNFRDKRLITLLSGVEKNLVICLQRRVVVLKLGTLGTRAAFFRGFWRDFSQSKERRSASPPTRRRTKCGPTRQENVWESSTLALNRVCQTNRFDFTLLF